METLHSSWKSFTKWFFDRIWNKIEFPLFRPALEKILYILLALVGTWRQLHYVFSPFWPAYGGERVIETPFFSFQGIQVHAIQCPFSHWPTLWWLGALAFLVYLHIVANARTYNAMGTNVSADAVRTRNRTWNPVAYATAFLIFIMLMTTTWLP